MRVTCYPLWRNAPPGTDACYLLKPDKKTGLCSLSSATDELTDETYATIADPETLLIQLIGPKNNTNENRFRHAKRWDQIAEYETDYWLQRIKPE